MLLGLREQSGVTPLHRRTYHILLSIYGVLPGGEPLIQHESTCGKKLKIPID